MMQKPKTDAQAKTNTEGKLKLMQKTNAQTKANTDLSQSKHKTKADTQARLMQMQKRKQV